MSIDTPPPLPAATSSSRSRATFKNRLGHWFFSVVALVIIPMFPLFVEAVRHEWKIVPENYLMTAAVLAAGYGFASEGNWFRAAYTLVFLYSVGYDFRPTAEATAEASAKTDEIGTTLGAILTHIWTWIAAHPQLDPVLFVAGLQSIERFSWHVVFGRLFPDWRKDG
jgi:hypothetical protein